MPSDNQVNVKKAVIVVGFTFILSVSMLAYIYFNFPKLEEKEQQYVKLPRDMEDARNLGRVLNRYKDRYFIEVLLAVILTFIFLQTFAIPGTIFLSVLSGFLFPFPVALLLVCFCSATGATLCYMISYFVGRRLIWKYFPEKSEKYSKMVEKHKDDIFNYMIFLRVTPFLPNWFINIAAPVINVPVIPFWLGTFLGVAPPSFIAIKAGGTLHEMSHSAGALSWNSVLLLGGFAILSLLPVLLRHRLKKKYE